MKFDISQIKLYRPSPESHKGQNGKLLVIGGSKLFHSSIFWAADVASRIVDIVHLTSPANENNEIVRKKIKEKFWNGIVVDWTSVNEYIEEDDVVLIGPGMERDLETETISNNLLSKYPDKKWIVDGGALQMADPKLLNQNMIITPHQGEFQLLLKKVKISNFKVEDAIEKTKQLSKKLNGCTVLLKGPIDIVCQGDCETEISAGNPGMTKGGTGDVLAGLVAGLYCKNNAWIAATAGSWVNKTAGDELYKKVGSFFNAADLVKEVPKIMVHLSPEESQGPNMLDAKFRFFAGEDDF